MTKSHLSSSKNSLLPSDYPELLASLKTRIRQARVRAHLSVNRELVLLYWNVGREISAKLENSDWGKKTVKLLSKDLQLTFPNFKGLSPSNLYYMSRLAKAWPDPEIFQQLAGKIPWTHNCVLLDKVKSPKNENGTSAPPYKTVGAGRSWSTRSRQTCITGKASQSPTSRKPSLRTPLRTPAGNHQRPLQPGISRHRPDRQGARTPSQTHPSYAGIPHRTGGRICLRWQ